MKKVPIVLMILLVMLLVISTIGCGKIEEIKGKVADKISPSPPAASPESASAPIGIPSKNSSAETLSAYPVTPAMEEAPTKPGNTILPPTSTPVQEPDLIIENITWSPLNPSPAEMVTFTINIKNQGDGSAAASQVYYYVDGSEKGSSIVSSIPAGGKVVNRFSWMVERLTYTVKVVADYNNNVIESDETNNEKGITFSGATIPEPDLIVEDITWSPLDPSPGETVTFTIIIKNQGDGSTAASQVYYYVDGSQEGSDNISSIAAGGTATGTFTWNSESGDHVIKAVADYNNDVPESDETNNEKELASSEVFLADLIIQSITWSPLNPSPSETVTFTFVVKNQGNGSAGPSTVYYYIGDYGKGPVPVSSISAGGTASGNFTWAVAQGNPTIAALADYYKVVSESDESNNIKQVTVPKMSTSSPADLIIQDITWSPLNPSPGETVTFTVTVKNQGGDIAVASQVYYYVDGSEKGSSTVSSIPAGGTATETFTWNAELGDHIIKAVADYNDAVSESSEANNEKEITFSGTLLIDLIVEDITWSPLNPFFDENFTFTITIKNQGDDETGSFQVYYYVNGSEKGSSTVSSIPAGGSASGNFTWKAELGDHVIKAVADYNDDVPETDETNNEKEITFSGTTVPEPDLIIQDITWRPINPSAGETIIFTVTIKNQGSGKARSFWIYYYINGIRIYPLGRVLEISAGDIWIETFTWNALPGTHAIKLIADQYNQLSESDETNNEKETTFVVK